MALGRAGLRNVLYDACPEAFQDKLTPPPPFHSPSAVLQVGSRGGGAQRKSVVRA